jgi:hypothetical protein
MCGDQHVVGSHAISATALGAIQRGIRATQHPLGIAPVRRLAHGDATGDGEGRHIGINKN